MKILILTAVYPRPDAPAQSTATRVIQYFAAAWKRMGHEVAVVHTANRLPAPIYYLPAGLKGKIKAKTGFEVPDRSITRETDYVLDGIPVFRRSLYKAVPRHLHRDKTVARCAARIHASLDATGFIPDLIVGHWASPNAQLLAALRNYYPCPNALVFHGPEYARRYPTRIKRALERIDRIGARSAPMARELTDLLSLPKTPFVCYSGVPDDYVAEVTQYPLSTFEQVTEFLYAGTLMERKNVDTVIRALATHTDRPWHLRVVGEGDCLASLRVLAASLGVADRVEFCGRLPRERVLELMREAHVFTMVSRNEAFGLVYLEAMAAGALTVGSRDEGIDGVILDGVNGFLSPSGDAEALAALYGRIFEMPPEARRAVAGQGRATAAAMTDTTVAARYLCDLISSENLK